jgi:hypothetical protein
LELTTAVAQSPLETDLPTSVGVMTQQVLCLRVAAHGAIAGWTWVNLSRRSLRQNRSPVVPAELDRAHDAARASCNAQAIRGCRGWYRRSAGLNRRAGSFRWVASNLARGSQRDAQSEPCWLEQQRTFLRT